MVLKLHHLVARFDRCLVRFPSMIATRSNQRSPVLNVGPGQPRSPVPMRPHSPQNQPPRAPSPKTQSLPKNYRAISPKRESSSPKAARAASPKSPWGPSSSSQRVGSPSPTSTWSAAVSSSVHDVRAKVMDHNAKSEATRVKSEPGSHVRPHSPTPSSEPANLSQSQGEPEPPRKKQKLQVCGL